MRRALLGFLLAACPAATASAAGWFPLAAPPSCSPISPPSGGIYDSTNLSGSGPTGGTFTTSNVISPDCTVDGSTFVEDTSTGMHDVTVGNAEIVHTFTAASATVTVYTKNGVGNRTMQLVMFNSTFASQANIQVNPTTCAIVGTPFTNFAGAAVSEVLTQTGSWCKAAMTTNPITASGVWIQALSYTTSNSYTGDGVSSLEYWGVGLTSP